MVQEVMTGRERDYCERVRRLRVAGGGCLLRQQELSVRESVCVGECP
jgi:hypothetical protein